MKLTIPVSVDGYTVADGREILFNQMGGFANYRPNIPHSPKLVTATWTVDRNGYKYIRDFYRTAVKEASTPFKVDLIIDEAELTEHDCFFVPNTMRLQEQRGHRYVVSASLEVRALRYDPTLDGYWIALISYFGIDYWETAVDIIDIIINYEFPDYMDGDHPV
jgi:hypothetical protein